MSKSNLIKRSIVLLTILLIVIIMVVVFVVNIFHDDRLNKEEYLATTSGESDLLSNYIKSGITIDGIEGNMKVVDASYIVPYSNTANDVAQEETLGRKCIRQSSTPAIWGMVIGQTGYNGWMCISSTYEGSILTSASEYGESINFTATTLKGHTIYCSYMSSRLMGLSSIKVQINQENKYASTVFSVEQNLTNAAKYLADYYLFGERY